MSSCSSRREGVAWSIVRTDHLRLSFHTSTTLTWHTSPVSIHKIDRIWGLTFSYKWALWELLVLWSVYISRFGLHRSCWANLTELCLTNSSHSPRLVCTLHYFGIKCYIWDGHLKQQLGRRIIFSALWMVTSQTTLTQVGRVKEPFGSRLVTQMERVSYHALIIHHATKNRPGWHFRFSRFSLIYGNNTNHFKGTYIIHQFF